MGKGMASRAWHSIWYGLTMHGMVYGIAWRAWHGISYGLVDMAWHMVCPRGHNMVIGYGPPRQSMVYDMAWQCMAWRGVVCRAGHGTWHGLASMAWYTEWHCGTWHGTW